VTGTVWWYLARSAALVAWLMLTASVLWGIFLSTKLLGSAKRPRWLLDLHRWLGGLTIAFVVLHVGALIADSTVYFDLASVTVPFVSAWRPSAVALGVVAAWVLVAVQATSLLIKRLPRAVWRGVHVTSFGTFWLVSLHSALAGTDAVQPLYRWTAIGASAAMLAGTTYRILTRRPPRSTARPPTSRQRI
jgi:predicted ferric reductase